MDATWRTGEVRCEEAAIQSATKTHLRLDGEDLQRRDADLGDLEEFQFITERFGDGVDRLLVRSS